MWPQTDRELTEYSTPTSSILSAAGVVRELNLFLTKRTHSPASLASLWMAWDLVLASASDLRFGGGGTTTSAILACRRADGPAGPHSLAAQPRRTSSLLRSRCLPRRRPTDSATFTWPSGAAHLDVPAAPRNLSIKLAAPRAFHARASRTLCSGFFLLSCFHTRHPRSLPRFARY